MLLTVHMRISQLIQQRSECQTKLRRMKAEKYDLKKYAEHIADGKISLFEMFRTPTSMFNRQMLYLQTSSVFCQQSAGNQMNYMMASPNYQQFMMNQAQQNPQYQEAYQRMMYENFYKEAQKEFAKYEAGMIHEKETEVEEQEESIKLELAMIEAELKDLKQQRQNEVQNTFGSQA